MSSFLTVLYFVGVFSTAIVHGYSEECDFNQTIFAPDGTTANFQFNISSEIGYRSLRMIKTSGTFSASVLKFNVDIDGYDMDFRDRTWENRTQISSQLYPDNLFNVKIDLNNVSMNDNGTYKIRYEYHPFFFFTDTSCFILFVMEIKTEPSNVREENEPVLVYAHPHASLIKRPLANATMTWLLDGQSLNQTASYIQLNGYMWISGVRRGLDKKNVTYRAVQDDGRIIELNTTLKVKYGPGHTPVLVPKKRHYNLVSGEILPDITCSSECNPPCNISWGEYSETSTLSLGAVTTEDTGEYTCIATRASSRTVKQIISVFVSDNSHFTTAIVGLATFQALTILLLGICTFIMYKRNAPSCCHQVLEIVSKNKSDNNNVTFSVPPVQVSENRCYEELRHGTGNPNNTYGEVNLAMTGDAVQHPANTYENTNMSN